jgi:Protein of unknown function (DUF2510)
LPEQPSGQDRNPEKKRTPAGWYLDGNGINRWWDGGKWGEAAQAVASGSPDELTLSAPTAKIVLLAIVCGLFTLGGFFLLVTGDVAGVLAGILCIALFGVVGFIGVRKIWKQRTILTLSSEGIRPGAGGFIPWGDFESIGIGRIAAGPTGTKVLGIRLSSYERYLGSLSPDQLQQMTRGAKWGKLAGFATLPSVAPEDIVKAIAKWDLSELQQGPLLSLPQKNFAAMLKWSRDLSGGWDLTYSPMLFDRPCEQVVQEIENFRQSVIRRRG